MLLDVIFTKDNFSNILNYLIFFNDHRSHIPIALIIFVYISYNLNRTFVLKLLLFFYFLFSFFSSSINFNFKSLVEILYTSSIDYTIITLSNCEWAKRAKLLTRSIFIAIKFCAEFILSKKNGSIRIKL